MDEEERCRKVESRKKVAYMIRSLVSARGLNFECARMLNERLLAPALI